MVTCTESNSTHPGAIRAKLKAPNNPSQAESVSLGTEPGRTVQLERVSVKLGRFLEYSICSVLASSCSFCIYLALAYMDLFLSSQVRSSACVLFLDL